MNLKAKVKFIDNLVAWASEMNQLRPWPGYDQYLARLLAERQKVTMQIGRKK